MSHAASTWAWEQDIPTGPKIVLLDLADRHNGQSGKCVAKVATIAARTGQCARSVQRHLGDLVQWGLIALQSRHKRAHRFILRLPEATAAATDQPARPEREPAPIRDTVSPTAPAFATQCHPEPEEKDSTGRKEEREPPASPPGPAPVSSPVSIQPAKQEASRIEAVPICRPKPPESRRSARKTSLPDDWIPPREVRELAIEAGHNPDGLMEEMADWCRDKNHHSADWPAFARRWIRLERKFRPGRAAASGNPVKKQARILQTFAAFSAARQHREVQL